MARDLFTRYVWIVDTITRYGRITREKLNQLWLRASITDGRPIPERTFFHYRRCIEEVFHIDILCNANGEYYVRQPEGKRDKALSNWLLDSYAVRTAMTGPEAASKVMVDEVPSAREFLPMALEAATAGEKIRFSYAGFNRSRTEHGIIFHPYFLRLYKQRWYMVGLKENDSRILPNRNIRTYALDRVKEMALTGEKFELPADATPEAYFADILGITSSQAAVRNVRIRSNPTTAKYLRALPLHPSQQEIIQKDGSLFTYRLKLNYELVHELLGMGADVEVLEPAELRTMLIEEVNKLNALYSLPGDCSH